jgi:sugar lactone lactonase YvrE
MYPRPDYEGKPWSHWGQGLVTADGRFFSGIGDHHGADGNSFIYEYDPSTMTLTRVVDVLATVEHQPGAWGYGKIHAQMVAGACDQIYVATYWGTRRGLTFTNGYDGDLLLRLDPSSRTTENVGVIMPEHGVASMAASPDGSLIYAEAADPFGEKVGFFVALDPATGEVVFSDDDEAHIGYRSIAVAADGSAYIAWTNSGLARYDPETNSLEETGMSIPGEFLRAVTEPAADGRIYAVSRDPAVFFVIEPGGEITELGPALGYTASMALAPDGEHFYYVPDAHGGAWENGTPLIAVDTATGESTVVVELNPLVEGQFGLRAGGTYNVVVSEDGSTVFVALNAGDPATDDSFGEVVLAVVTLP